MHIPIPHASANDIHIHFPEGATPKDGPSAGLAIATALISELNGIPVRHDVSITGELSLHGKAMAIGGLREKTMAAYLAGVKTIVMPKDNEMNLESIPEIVKENCALHFVSTIREVWDLALTSDPYEMGRLMAEQEEKERENKETEAQAEETTIGEL